MELNDIINYLEDLYDMSDFIMYESVGKNKKKLRKKLRKMINHLKNDEVEDIIEEEFVNRYD